MYDTLKKPTFKGVTLKVSRSLPSPDERRDFTGCFGARSSREARGGRLQPRVLRGSDRHASRVLQRDRAWRKERYVEHFAQDLRRAPHQSFRTHAQGRSVAEHQIHLMSRASFALGVTSDVPEHRHRHRRRLHARCLLSLRLRRSSRVCCAMGLLAERAIRQIVLCASSVSILLSEFEVQLAYKRNARLGSSLTSASGRFSSLEPDEHYQASNDDRVARMLSATEVDRLRTWANEVVARYGGDGCKSRAHQQSDHCK